jgi:hypothetical protein
MAIKGKKSKSKPKGPVRAPRREVVELPTPFLQRRLVQLALSLILGLLIFWFGVWLTNGWRADGRKNDAKKAQAAKTAQGAKQRLAVQSWKGTVDAAIGDIGTAPTDAGNPTIFTDLSTASASLAEGTSPSGVTDTLRKAQSSAAAAEKALNAVDISSDRSHRCLQGSICTTSRRSSRSRPPTRRVTPASRSVRKRSRSKPPRPASSTMDGVSCRRRWPPSTSSRRLRRAWVRPAGLGRFPLDPRLS